MAWSERPLPALTLAVVGAPFANADGSDRRAEIARCQAGELVELRPEPDNKKDERAVAVFSSRGVQLGYLSAERCGRIGSILRSGREVQAVFQTADTFGAWIRVAFDGQAPALPLPPETKLVEGDDGWFPDESWPD